MSKFAFVIHTHTDCKDIWPMFFGQLNKYFPKYNKYVLVNKPSPEIDCSYKFIYNENLSYVERFELILKKIPEDVVLFTHEDMIPYDSPDIKQMDYFCDLIRNSHAEFIKLLKCKNPNEEFKISNTNPNLVKCSKDFSFTVQPTLCNKNSLLNLFLKAKSIGELSIWDFEKEMGNIITEDLSEKCFMSSHIDEGQRGIYHWDSKFYPHGNMIFKGKWTYSEYKKELDFLFKEYNISLKNRGFHG